MAKFYFVFSTVQCTVFILINHQMVTALNASILVKTHNQFSLTPINSIRLKIKKGY